MKIDIKNRIAWLNLTSSYIHAAETISKEIQRSTDEPEKKWQHEVMVIPLLYLLRHSLELSLKSVLISHSVEFEPIHDLQTLLNEAGKQIDLSAKASQKNWHEVEDVIAMFSETGYGGKIMFKDGDINASALRYLRDTGDYSELKNIDHRNLVEKVWRVRLLCELLTLTLDTQP